MRHKKLLTVMLAAVMAFRPSGAGGANPQKVQLLLLKVRRKENRHQSLRPGKALRQTDKKWKFVLPGGAIPRETICTMKYATDLRKPIPTSRS